MSTVHPSDVPWWSLEQPDQQANELWSIADGLREAQQAREQWFRICVSEYEGRTLDQLAIRTALAADGSKSPEEACLLVGRSLCDTVHADIGGRQRPKVQFQTSGADWQTRRRAKRLDKFVSGVMAQPQGRYVSGHELAEDAFLDSAIAGMGCLHVYPDADGNRIGIERVFSYELLVDPEAAQYGDPQDLFRMRRMDRSQVLRMFVTEELSEEERVRIESAILAAPPLDAEQFGQPGKRRLSDQILVCEAWHLKQPDEEHGAHAWCVPGAILDSEEYDWDSFPFVVMRWAPHRFGWDASGLIAEVRELAAQINEYFARIQEAAKLRSGRRVYFEADSLDEDHMQANDTETIIPVKAGAKLPTVEAVSPFQPVELEYLDWMVKQAFDFSGVSQMSATARKEPGVTAAVAMRTLKDIATKRFAIRARMYESAHVQLARLIARAAADMPGDFRVKLPGSSVAREIAWSEASLKEDQYQISIATMSGLPDEPAGRLSTAQELFSQGAISSATFQRLVDWTDLDQEFARVNAEYEYLEDLCDQYLDATAEQLADGQFWRQPEGFLFGLESAISQVGAIYFTAAREGAPEANLELLRRYITELQYLLDQKIAAQQAAQAPQQAAGPPGLGPGGPPSLPATTGAMPAGGPPLPQAA